MTFEPPTDVKMCAKEGEPGDKATIHFVPSIPHGLRVYTLCCSGHYISDVCSVGEGVWRSYNDSYVTEAREEDIRQRRKGTGYIFFYMHK